MLGSSSAATNRKAIHLIPFDSGKVAAWMWS